MFGFLKGSRYVTDFSSIGQLVGSKGKEAGSIEFDFIIIGGGTAGCALASRLSEDPSFRVLLLESGGSGKNVIFSRIPSAFGLLFHTKHIYELHTEPQEFAGGLTKYWPRGKMLGGCSSVNAEMAQYGAPGDFDEWGKITGDQTWNWYNFHKYFRKFEKYIPNPEYPGVDASKKGFNGPVHVGYFSNLEPQCQDFITSCIRVNIPFSQDFNTTSGTRGVSRIMTYIDHRRKRVSSETAYLTREALSRPNLVVATHARVTKIIFDNKAEESPRAIGVEFTKGKESPLYQARARKEVVVSAGAIHSPQILMLSGVGNGSELEEHGIPVIHDLPSVGSNLVDHPVVNLAFKSKSLTPKYIQPHSVLDALKFLGSALKYFIAGGGPLSSNLAEAAAFLRSDDPGLFKPEDFPVKLHDNTSGLDSPDLELFSTIFGYKNHSMHPEHSVGLHVVLLRPASKGSLRLKSGDPWDNPAMDPRYLEEPEDVEKLVRGVKMACRLARTEPLSSRIDHTSKGPLLDQDLPYKTDQELQEIVRERVQTLYHPVGTCRMAPATDAGVVDTQLRVYGVRNLRVCDASVFPKIVSGHTAGAVYAIAEKFADMLKEEYTNKTG